MERTQAFGPTKQLTSLQLAKANKPERHGSKIQVLSCEYKPDGLNSYQQLCPHYQQLQIVLPLPLSIGFPVVLGRLREMPGLKVL